MRWVTPQELAKITKKSPDPEKMLSERSIRHMAVQKRISTKKVGRSWLIDPNSVIKAGLYIEEEDLKNLKENNPPTENSSNTNNSKTSNTKKSKKYQSLGELGVYKELKTLYLEKGKTMSDSINESVKQTLFNLALGFYEYHKVNKVEYFQKARKFLVKAIVEDDLGSKESNKWRDQLENSIMPGIVGLIRKQEVGKNGQRGQTKTKGKN